MFFYASLLVADQEVCALTVLFCHQCKFNICCAYFTSFHTRPSLSPRILRVFSCPSRPSASLTSPSFSPTNIKLNILCTNQKNIPTNYKILQMKKGILRQYNAIQFAKWIENRYPARVGGDPLRPRGPTCGWIGARPTIVRNHSQAVVEGESCQRDLSL